MINLNKTKPDGKAKLIDKRAHIVQPKEEIMAIRYPPTDEKEIEQLGRDLVLYSRDPKNKSLNQFALDNWYTPHRLWKLAERNEYFKACLEYAKAAFAERMTRAACTREEDGKYIFEKLELVDVEYAALKREQSDRVTQLIQSRQNAIGFTVVMDKIPNSEAVPNRLIDDKEEIILEAE